MFFYFFLETGREQWREREKDWGHSKEKRETLGLRTLSFQTYTKAEKIKQTTLKSTLPVSTIIKRAAFVSSVGS